MQESSGKLPDGLFDVAYPFNLLHSIGSFDECLGLEVDVPRTKFKGKHCDVSFTLVPFNEIEDEQNQLDIQQRDNWFTILEFIGLSLKRINNSNDQSDGFYFSSFLPGNSLCVPDSCSALDLRNAIAHSIGTFAVPVGNETVAFQTITDERFCFTKDQEPKPFDSADITVL